MRKTRLIPSQEELEEKAATYQKDSIPDAKDLSEPTRIFSVGDRVTYGNWSESIVLQVYDEGKSYKLFTKMSEEDSPKYRPDLVRRGYAYVTWVRVLPFRDRYSSFPERVLEEDSDIRVQFSPRGISHILFSYQSRHMGFDFSPDYQRDFIWTLNQKVELIDSIFKWVDIGKFVIIRNEFDASRVYHQEVLDGKQRMSAIIEFYESRFRYKGLFFHELHPWDQDHFCSYSIAWGEVSNLSEKKRLRLFIRLNTSGTPISKEQLEKVSLLLNEGDVQS